MKYKNVLAIVAVMAVFYTVGYYMGCHNTNTKWQIEQAKNWRPLKG
jgi:hypothetical protein